MNKYEKALNDLADIVGKMGNINIKTLKTYKILTELVERATPMKCVWPENVDNGTQPCCPNCYDPDIKDMFDSFCSNCGQALDWSE